MTSAVLIWGPESGPMSTMRPVAPGSVSDRLAGPIVEPLRRPVFCAWPLRISGKFVSGIMLDCICWVGISFQTVFVDRTMAAHFAGRRAGIQVGKLEASYQYAGQ